MQLTLLEHTLSPAALGIGRGEAEEPFDKELVSEEVRDASRRESESVPMQEFQTRPCAIPPESVQRDGVPLPRVWS